MTSLFTQGTLPPPPHTHPLPFLRLRLLLPLDRGEGDGFQHRTVVLRLGTKCQRQSAAVPADFECL